MMSVHTRSPLPGPLPSVGCDRDPGARVLTLAVALVSCADFLFFRHPRGFTLGVYGALAGAAMLACRGRSRSRESPGAILLASLLALACAALTVETTRSGLVLAGALVLLLAALPEREAALPELDRWLERLVTLLTRLPLCLFRDVTTVHPARARAAASRGRSLGTELVDVARGWALPLLISGVFLALLHLANPVLASSVQHVIDIGKDLLVRMIRFPEPMRVAFWLLSATLVWGLLRGVAAADPGWQRARERLRGSVPAGEALDGVQLFRSLVLLNALFAVENGLDLVYLWGGRGLPQGMTYASYAHRGAYPLVVTALLAAALVLVTFRPGGPAARSGATRGLVYAWLAQNILLTGSAAWRLGCYVDVYGLTRLRLAAALWMLLVAGGLALIFARIALGRSNGWLLRANLATLTAVLYFSAFADLDGTVAWHNVRLAATSDSGHATPGAAGGNRGRVYVFDAAYLIRLGASALPALDWLAANDPLTPRRREAAAGAARARSTLRVELSDWRGITLRKARTVGWDQVRIMVGEGASSDAAFAVAAPSVP